MNENDKKLISAYLLDDLSPEDRTSLESRLGEEPELARELADQQEFRTYLKTREQRPALDAKMAELAGTFRAIGEQETSTPKAKVRRLRPWMGAVGVAAAIALLVLVFNPFASPDLYRQYAQHQPLNLVEKGDSEAMAEAAQAAFNAGDYAQAYPQLKAYLEKEPADVPAQLALGIAALETDRQQEAESIFSSLAGGESVLAAAGQFYLGLAYLKNEKPAQAREALQGVPATHPDYGPRARDLLNALAEE